MKMHFRYKAAQSFAWACRFKGLQLAKMTFRSVDGSSVFSRPYFGYKLFLNIGRSNTHQLLYLEGERFVREQALLTGLVKQGDVIIDVGANIGYYLLMFEKLAGDRGHVFCFEPEPENLSELKRNIAGNHLNNVSCFEAAVGDKCGTTYLARGLNAMVCEEDEGLTLEVKMLTLDSVIEQEVDVIKIDVEGFEGQVLEGARNIIRRSRPALFVEVHPFLLSKPFSTSTILLFAEEFYSDIRFYDGQVRGLVGKMSSRYTGRNAVNQINDRAEILERSQVFWMICK